MKMKKSVLTALVAVGSFAVLAGCAPGPDNSGGGTELTGWAKIEQQARDEGELTLYTTAHDGVNVPWVEAFNKEYPEIRVSVTRLSSGDLSVRYSSEKETGAPSADVLYLSNALLMNDHPEWFKSLAADEVPNFDAVPEQYKFDSYVSIAAAPLVFTINTDKMDAADVPKTWEGLLDPKLSGKGIIPSPEAAVTFASFFAGMDDTYGDEFLTELGGAGNTFTDKVADGMQQLAAGTAAWMAPAQDAHSLELRDSGAPLEVFPITPSVGPVYALGIDSEAQHPNAALVFMNFALTEAAMEPQCAASFVPIIDVSTSGCDSLPSDFTAVDDVAGAAERDRLMSLLGLGG